MLNSINKKFSILIGVTVLVLMIIFTLFMISSINKNLLKELETNLKIQVSNYFDTAEIYNDSLEKNSLVLMSVFKKSFRNLRLKGNQKVKVNGVETLALFDGFSRVNRNFEPVDYFTSQTGAAAAVFVKEKGKYIRITSSLKDENDKRILLDKIDDSSSIFSNLESKKKFIGLETISSKNYMSVYSPIIKKGKIIGALYIGYDFTKGLDSLRNRLKKIIIGDTGYIYVLNSKGDVLMHKSLEGKNISKLKDADGKLFIQKILDNKNGTIRYNYNENNQTREKIAAFTEYKKWDWIIVAGSYEEEFLAISTEVKKVFIVATIILTLILLFIIIILVNKIVSKPLYVFQNGLLDFFEYLNNTKKEVNVINVTSNDEIGKMALIINKNIQSIKIQLNEDNMLINDVKEVVSEIGEGYFSKRITKSCSSLSLLELKTLINTMLDNLESYIGKDINKITNILESYSSRDFTKELSVDSSGKIGLLIISMNKMISELLNDSENDGLKLKNTSDILSSNVNILSKNAINQASSLEEVAASITQISENINDTSLKAQNMYELSANTKESSKVGKNLASDTDISMSEINEKVQTISESIEIIDQIAFQTNILSLNAAVEAATAGEAGKGFAVVAQEVRNLASRSAEAANEITKLVESASVQAIKGKEITSKMIKGFENLEEKINETDIIIDDVANSAKEQTLVMTHISDTVNSLDKFTQENANVAEQTSVVSKDIDILSQNILINVEKSQFNKE